MSSIGKVMCSLETPKEGNKERKCKGLLINKVAILDPTPPPSLKRKEKKKERKGKGRHSITTWVDKCGASQKGRELTQTLLKVFASRRLFLSKNIVTILYTKRY